VSELPELQQAVRALRGVAHATVRWPEPGGPATLHIIFERDADRDEVTREVLDALQRVGDVDLATLRVQVPPPPGAPAPETGEPRRSAEAEAGARGPGQPAVVDEGRRPVFSGLSVERTNLDNTVVVTLRLGERLLTGRADGLATRRATPRTAAAAALLALREVVPRDTRLYLEWLEIVDAASPERPTVVQSAVTCLTASGEETYIGSAIVRDDVREAAVRATLDALNRRLERFAALAS
jgi:hypothetical protein